MSLMPNFLLGAIFVIQLFACVSAADQVKFYWVYKVFAAKDAQCTGLSTESRYMTNLNLGKYYGGGGTNSECIQVKEISRFYTYWCDTSTGTIGVQEFIKPDCSDPKFPANPALSGDRGGKNVYWTVKGECYYDSGYDVSVKSEGCFAEQSKVPAGYTQFSPASRIGGPWFIVLLSLSSLLFVRGHPK
jgi:hypothetical protein